MAVAQAAYNLRCFLVLLEPTKRGHHWLYNIIRICKVLGSSSVTGSWDVSLNTNNTIQTSCPLQGKWQIHVHSCHMSKIEIQLDLPCMLTWKLGNYKEQSSNKCTWELQTGLMSTHLRWGCHQVAHQTVDMQGTNFISLCICIQVQSKFQ
jgi:hypothetical protein